MMWPHVRLGIGVSIVITASVLVGLGMLWRGHRAPRRADVVGFETSVARKIADGWPARQPCPPFLDQLFVDPWGREYQFACRRDAIWVRSAGPDSLFGTDDDITTYWKRDPR